jgi:hypothetical protein
MRYDEFRDSLVNMLSAAGLFAEIEGSALETIEISDSIRHWKQRIRTAAPMLRDPFHIEARVSFEWGPTDAARAHIDDEYVLLKLLGERKQYPLTGPRLLRVELKLRALLPHGSRTPIPAPPLLGSWASSVGTKLDKALPDLQDEDGRTRSFTGGREGDISIRVYLSPEGALFLQGAAVKCFRYVRIPRVWDERLPKPDPPAADELDELAGCFRYAVDEWNLGVADLAKSIQYAPPRPETNSR